MGKSLNPRTTNNPEGPDTGEAAAAIKNRQVGARLQIVAAFQRLGLPYREWPDFVQKFHASPQAQALFQESISPPGFQPPDFERLTESAAEWKKRADAGWRRHRDDFLQQCQSFVELGIDEEIPPTKNIRGGGRKGRNAPTDQRFEWAARRLMGAPWKEIAAESFQVDQVKKAASEVLKRADWPTKVKRS